MRKAIIHINQHIIRSNIKASTKDPPITVRAGGMTKRVSEVVIRHDDVVVGKLIYSPEKPLNCGAKLYLVCDLNVVDLELFQTSKVEDDSADIRPTDI